VEPSIQEIQIDPLAKFRAEIAAEKAEPRGKMSEAAVAKLRAQAAADKADSIVSERFKNALRSVVVTDENLRSLILRCNTTPALLDEKGECYRGWLDGSYKFHKFTDVLAIDKLIGRMVTKLSWWITAGYLLGREIDEVALINALSNLTLTEVRMSDAKFTSTWNPKDAEKRRLSRINRGLISADLKVAVKVPYWNPKRCRAKGLCKAGNLCIKASNSGKPALAAEGKQFCSENCQGSYPVRLQKAA
jgi:hypothetical protein